MYSIPYLQGICYQNGLLSQEIEALELQTEMIQKQIQVKDSSLKVAETRLKTRAARPAIESCNDDPHTLLVKEINDLHRNINLLQEKLQNTMHQLSSLHETKKKLEEDIRIKNFSILVDKMKCMAALRRIFPYKPKTSRVLTF